jgi:Cof subfamily protein (haloacid dehalogenase superfamily)
MLVMDVDGTFTPPGGYIPPESAVRAVTGARELGHKVFLCSGRNYGMLEPIHKYGFDGGIASCGGYVYAGDKVLYDCPLTEEQKNKVMTLLSDEGVFLSIEGKDNAYSDVRARDFLTDGINRNNYLLSMIEAVWIGLGPKPLTEYDGCPLYKVVFTCNDRAQIAPAEAALGDELQFIVHDFSEPGCVFGEIINRKFDKGRAVRVVADALGFDMADTIGFGDSNIDIEMIEAVGTSVCMENGSDFLKERSDIICPSTDNDGIEWAFRKLGLID